MYFFVVVVARHIKKTKCGQVFFVINDDEFGFIFFVVVVVIGREKRKKNSIWKMKLKKKMMVSSPYLWLVKCYDLYEFQSPLDCINERDLHVSEREIWIGGKWEFSSFFLWDSLINYSTREINVWWPIIVPNGTRMRAAAYHERSFEILEKGRWDLERNYWHLFSKRWGRRRRLRRQGATRLSLMAK